MKLAGVMLGLAAFVIGTAQGALEIGVLMLVVFVLCGWFA